MLQNNPIKKPPELKAGQRVCLTVDLTKYHQALVAGAKGTLIAECGRKAPWVGNKTFGHVVFDDAGPWDILWNGLIQASCVDAASDDELRAELQRRGLTAAPAIAGSRAEQLIGYIASELGPDLWQGLVAAFEKKFPASVKGQ